MSTIAPPHENTESLSSGFSICIDEDKGFTLVELLVVVGIIALLIAILLPALATARFHARTVQCASNERQLAMYFHMYAAQNNGWLPPNILLPTPIAWYDWDRIGRLYSPKIQSAAQGPALTCPDDSNSLRSYAMNQWASSTMDQQFLKTPYTGFSTKWKLGQGPSNKLILVAEKWSSATSGSSWVASATLGASPFTAGRRLGALAGIVFQTMQFGQANTEVPFIRHRKRQGPGAGIQAIGQVNIAYADGHVELKTNSALADPVSGLSRLDSLWSKTDFQTP